MTLLEFIEIFQLCCFGRNKPEKPQKPQIQIIDTFATYDADTSQFYEIDDDEDSPPDPRDTEWWSDYSLTEIESIEASDDELGI